MVLYGYKNEGLPIEDVEPSELAEITLVATPEELRRIATFLESAADSMERMGSAYAHEHLSDKMPEFEESPHFVVINAQRHSR
jgi:hypothetical protein